MANSINVKATFTGTNGSRGFVTGNEYTLKLSKHPDGSLFAENCPDRLLFCEYGSFIAFLNNWNTIITYYNRVV